MRRNRALPPRGVPGGRAVNRAALIEAALLGGVALLLLAQAGRGALILYIHPRYVPLVVAAAVVLLLLGGGRLVALRAVGPPPVPGRYAGYLLVALPLAVALVIPARPLGADTLTAAPRAAVRPKAPAPDDSRRWNLLQWVTAVGVRGAATEGQPADLVGFVYHDPARPFDGFFVARLVIVCCVADGSGVTLPVAWAGGASLPANSWVRVQGTLGTTTIDGRAEPAIRASAVAIVPQPPAPYLYP